MEFSGEIRHAKEAGLRYVHSDEPGYTRVKKGKGFQFLDEKRNLIHDDEEISRLKKLAIPPAYVDVWICKDPLGHLQFVALDVRGRKQYRYHKQWSDVRSGSKFKRMLKFAKSLPRIRRKTSADLRKSGLPREKVLAAVVRLLERTLIRVGNEQYAQSNESYGLSTFKNEHVKVESEEITFRFKGKSNVKHHIRLRDRALASIVKTCRKLPGSALFQYVDENEETHAIHSQDVNEYLQEITNCSYTAKDFRTWAATLLAAKAFAKSRKETESFRSVSETKKKLNEAIDQVAEKLGNTRNICRNSYIHPSLIQRFLEGKSIPEADEEEKIIEFLARVGSDAS